MSEVDVAVFLSPLQFHDLVQHPVFFVLMMQFEFGRLSMLYCFDIKEM